MNLSHIVFQHRKSNLQSSTLWAILERPPLLHHPDGFSPRWYHFLAALAQRYEVETLVAHRVNSSWSPEGIHESLGGSGTSLRYETVGQSFYAPGGRNHTLRLLWHHLTDSLPFMSQPRRWLTLKRLWREHPPHMGVFFLPQLAHFAFQLPKDVPCVCVLEEGIERLNDWTIYRLPQRWQGWTNANEQRRIRRFYRRLARRTAHFVVISEDEKRYFGASIPKRKITVIPHGIDCQYYSPGADGPPPDLDVAIFGRLDMSYNTEPALRLYRYAHEASSQESCHGHPLKWAFVGYNPVAEIKELESENVLVTGAVPDVRPYYERAKVVVVPTQLGTGVKTTVLQAWAMGCAVVATPFALKGVPAEHGKNVLIGKTPQELMGHIQDLLDNPTRREELAQAGLALVRAERDIRVLAQRFAEVCSHALNS